MNCARCTTSAICTGGPEICLLERARSIVSDICERVGRKVASRRLRRVGRFKRPDTLMSIVGFERYIKRSTENSCWIWLGRLNHDGYGILSAKIEGREKYLRAHRVAWQLFRGSIPRGVLVLHNCDVRACVNPDHLRLGDYFDNARDTAERWRDRLANKAERETLTTDDSLAIRSSPASTAELMKLYNVSAETISFLRRSNVAKHGLYVEMPE